MCQVRDGWEVGGVYGVAFFYLEGGGDGVRSDGFCAGVVWLVVWFGCVFGCVVGCVVGCGVGCVVVWGWMGCKGRVQS